MDNTVSQIITVVLSTDSMEKLKVVLKKIKTFTEIWNDDIIADIQYEKEQHSIFKIGQVSFIADNNPLRNSRFHFVLTQLIYNIKKDLPNSRFIIFTDFG